jgi:TolB protein
MPDHSVASLRRRLAGLAFVMLVPLLGAAARADLAIQITQGVNAPIPIAIVPFAAGPGPQPVDAAAVIEADLVRSGHFQALGHGSFLQSPTSSAAIDFASWRLVKVDYVVVGRQVSGSGGPALEFELCSVATGQRLIGFSLPVQGGWRLTAHRAADLIYQNIVGVRGAFATRIAYVSVEGQVPARRYRLVVADADGENSRVVAESREPIMSPVWSPDGTSLAYVSFETRLPAIYLQVLASGERRRLVSREGLNGAPAFSPDGQRLAFTGSTRDGNVDVYLKDLASGQELRVTDDPAIDTEPTFAPDGRSLYFTSDRSGRPQVYRLQLASGQKPVRVTFDGSYNARPRLTPDGTQLAVVTQDAGTYHIAVVDPATGRGRVLTRGQLDLGPSFAPNGQTILYATREKGRGVLATIAIDGGVTSRFSAAEGDIREPAWSPFPPGP